MSWISAAEFARRMKCSRANVTQAIKGGRIAAEHVRRDGSTVRISTAAIPSWEATASKRRPAPATTAAPPAATGSAAAKVGELPVLAWGQAIEEGERRLSPEELEAAVAELSPGAVPELGLSRQRREHALAQMAELDLREREGQLVPAAEVSRVWFETGRRVRDAVQRSAQRMMPAIAAAAGGLSPEQRAEMLLIIERHHVEALESLAGADPG